VKSRLLLVGLSVVLAIVAGSVTTYLVWPDPPKPIMNNDESCQRDSSLFCNNEVTDNVPIKGEEGYQTEKAAFLISNRVFSYSIETRGAVKTDIEAFASNVAETLTDSRGWGQIANFKRGQSTNFIIVLTEASQVPSFSSGCSAQWSCRAGNYVIINEDRWLGASDSWNSSGGSLRDYQHMVVSHEVGHWLGHGHTNCSGPGQLATVMQQQSISLQGCKHNPWPLEKELSVLR